MLRKAAILILLAIACVTPVDGKNTKTKVKGKPRESTGQYNFVVRGFVTGEGTATVGGDTIDLSAEVKAEAGGGGLLTATGLALVDNHFSGSGTVMGRPATFEGRLDVPSDAHERLIRGVRLACTVKTNDGSYAKVMGFIPAQAQARDYIDDEERGKDKKGKKNKK